MLEKNNEKMIEEITNLVNEVKSNLTNGINKSLIHRIKIVNCITTNFIKCI